MIHLSLSLLIQTLGLGSSTNPITLDEDDDVDDNVGDIIDIDDLTMLDQSHYMVVIDEEEDLSFEEETDSDDEAMDEDVDEAEDVDENGDEDEDNEDDAMEVDVPPPSSQVSGLVSIIATITNYLFSSLTIR